MLIKKIEEKNGKVIGEFKDPYGGVNLIFAKLPVKEIKHSKYQREINTSLINKLAESITKIGVFFEPVFCIYDEEKDEFRVINGSHRLEALSMLGSEYIITIIPEDKSKYEELIQYTNTEKAPNLRDKSIEALKIFEDYVKRLPEQPETILEDFIEKPYFITLGYAYIQETKFAGTVIEPFLKKTDNFNNEKFIVMKEKRQKWANKLLEVNAKLNELVAQYKEKYGKIPPYLKNQIFSLCNPVKGRGMYAYIEEALESLIKNLNEFDISIFENIEIK